MSRFNVMPRAYRRQLQAQDQANVEHALRQAGALNTEPQEHKRTTLKEELTKPGDWRKLRGIPAHARGVRGCMPGASPLGELMAKQPHDE